MPHPTPPNQPAERSGPHIPVANAPCSWGVIGMGDSGVPYGQMLDELVAAGYTGTELGDLGYMPTDPARLRDELESRGLALLGAFAGVDLRVAGVVERERPRLVQLVRLMAEAQDQARAPLLVLAQADGLDEVRSLNAGRITAAMGMSSAEWRELLRNAEEIARLALDTAGMRTVFHPHCAGYIETPQEVERLLEGTDPDLVGLVFDTGHHVYGEGGADEDGLTALRGLERFWERVRYVHFKDLDPRVARQARAEGWDHVHTVRAGLYCELGRGSIDFGAVVAFLRERGYPDWITVEQDVLPGMGTPLESARRNREYLRGLGL